MDYQGNSKHPKREVVAKKEITPVVESATEVKKPITRRVREVFFGSDIQSVSQYLVQDVLLPAARNLLVDFTTQGINRAVYGETAPRQPRRGYERSRPMTTYHNPERMRDPRYDLSLIHI